MTKPRSAEYRAQQQADAIARRGFTDAEVVAFLDAGHTTTQACDRFDVSPTTIRRITKESGRTPKPPETFWTADLKANLRELWSAVPQFSASKIGTLLGANKNMVISVARRMGLPERPRPANLANSQRKTREIVVTKARKPAVHKGGRPPLPTLPEAVHAEAVKLLRAGKGADRVANMLGISETHTRKILEIDRLAGIRRAPRNTRRQVFQRLPELEGSDMPLVEMMLAASRREVRAQEQTATVYAFPKAGTCCWISGDSPKTYRVCEELAVREPGMKPPFSYCKTHRRVAYAKREVAA